MTIQRVIDEYPKAILSQGTSFYRVRKNPRVPLANEEYDSPPNEFLGKGRLDSVDAPILYASQDLEACIHEYRVTIEDELYVATISLQNNITVLDLSDWIEEKVTEFDSLTIAIHFLFNAADHSYEILRDIAIATRMAGLDGILYPSYFTQIHRSDQTIRNIALFGRPVRDGIVKVDCINRVILNKVNYDIHFGPASF